jgi:hypothetical protein
LAEAEKALARAQSATPPLPSRAELEALTGDVARLWNAHSTSPRDRKRLLRTLIADVTLLAEPDLGKARIGVRWHTGATDEIVVARRMKVQQWRHTDPAAVEMVRNLAHLSNREIAQMLDQAGYKTGAGQPFRRAEVANLRIYHNIASAEYLSDGSLAASQVAKRLGIGPHTVIDWISKGWLSARRGLNNGWRVPFSPEVEAACRQRIAQSTQIHRPDSSEPQAGHERTATEVAVKLGISVFVVYHWVEHHYVQARRGPGGRWLITFDTAAEAECRRRIAASTQIRTSTKAKAAQLTSKEAV